MRRVLIITAVFAVALSMAACGKAPKEEKAAPAAEEQKAAPAEGQAPAEKAAAADEQKAAPAGEQAAEAADKAGEKAADKNAEEPSEEDPDEEGGTGRGASDVDKEKLAKAYEEIYCAQKKGEMEKILDIYKNY